MKTKKTIIYLSMLSLLLASCNSVSSTAGKTSPTDKQSESVSTTKSVVEDTTPSTSVNPNIGVKPVIVTTAETTPYSVTCGNVLSSFPAIICRLNGKTMSTKDYTVVDEKDPNAEIDVGKGTFRSNVVGAHTIKITATNPDDTTQVATDSFQINVYRKLFITHNSKYVEQWVGEPDKPVENQHMKLTDGTNNVGIFNLHAGKVYYAEATFEGFTTIAKGADYLGMAHYSDDPSLEEIKSDKNRWLGSAAQIGTGVPSQVNGRTSNLTTYNVVTDVQEWYKIDNNTSSGGVYFRNFSKTDLVGGVKGAESDSTTFHYAIARINNLFYSFVNGKLASIYTDRYFSSKNTIPGVWARMHTQAAEEGGADKWDGKVVTNMDYYDGEQATNKVNELLSQSNLITHWGANFCEDSIANKTIVVGETTEEKGLNFKCTVTTGSTNDNTATLNAAIGINFTLSFVYKKGDGTGNCYVDLRNNLWADTILNAGFDFNTNKAIVDAGNNWGTAIGDLGTDTLDDSQGVKVTITRTIDEDAKTSTYDITYTSIAKPTQTLTKQIVDSTYWNTAVFPVFKNRNLSGEWTNIELKVD